MPGLCRSVSGGAVRPLDALRRRTHLSGRLNSHRHARQDKTVAPACRPPPPQHRPGRQLRLAARPPTRSDVVRHAQCKHAVDCCIRLNLNFFTKRHATRVIYRLTVPTLPDGLETQFTPPDTTQTVLSVVSGGSCELGIISSCLRVCETALNAQ